MKHLRKKKHLAFFQKRKKVVERKTMANIIKKHKNVPNFTLRCVKYDIHAWCAKKTKKRAKIWAKIEFWGENGLFHCPAPEEIFCDLFYFGFFPFLLKGDLPAKAWPRLRARAQHNASPAPAAIDFFSQKNSTTATITLVCVRTSLLARQHSDEKREVMYRCHTPADSSARQRCTIPHLHRGRGPSSGGTSVGAGSSAGPRGRSQPGP